MPHRKQVRRAGLKSHPLVRDAHAPTARGAGVADVKDAPPCERAPVRAPLPRQRGRVRGRERRGAPESCGRETRRSWKRSEIGAVRSCLLFQTSLPYRSPRCVVGCTCAWHQGTHCFISCSQCNRVACMLACVSQWYLAREDMARRGGGDKVLDCLPCGSFWTSFW